MVCTHLDSICDVTPSANGYEDCVKTWRLMGAHSHVHSSGL